jgi:putative FmdB family regulatory protein
MPMYDYRCSAGHRFERNVALSDETAQSCPACGGPSAKIPSRIALGGTARTGRAMEQMPQTWRGTHDANREYVTALRREWDVRQRLEDKHPELQGDRRPILAHEGRFENAPLRAGDPLLGPSTPSVGPGHSRGSGHSHGPGHSHGHEHGHSQSPDSSAAKGAGAAG